MATTIAKGYIMNTTVLLTLLFTFLLFPFVGVLFYLMPENYPELHKQNRFVSYHGFNMAFMDFTPESWSTFRKKVFRFQMLSAFLHLAICVACFLFWREAAYLTIIKNSAIGVGVLDLLYGFSVLVRMQ
jgi:hypothetical protein